jgi:hypothetical protein
MRVALSDNGERAFVEQKGSIPNVNNKLAFVDTKDAEAATHSHRQEQRGGAGGASATGATAADAAIRPGAGATCPGHVAIGPIAMHAMTLPRIDCHKISHARRGLADASLPWIIVTGRSRDSMMGFVVKQHARGLHRLLRYYPGHLGTASPPMAAGAMLLMFNLAIALFVGLGPIFILCLIFEQTKLVLPVYILASSHLIAQTRGAARFNAMIRRLFFLTALSVSELTKEVEL